MDAVLNFLPYVGYILAAIMLLVTIHELGHFLAAKAFGMRVEKFSVGFPPKVLSKTIGETEYVIAALPLGGYVKISGMVDESLDTDGLASDPQPWEFRSKPVWQRIVVITAGVIFNVIFAWIIFTGLKMAYGEAYIPAANIRSVYVEPGSVAARMGIESGDRLVAIGGKPLDRFDDILPRLLNADPLTVTVARGGRDTVLSGPRDIITQLNRTQGAFGVSADPPLVGDTAPGSPAEAAGLQTGDRIEAVDGAPIAFWSDLLAAVQATNGRAVAVRFARPDSLATPSDTALTRVGAASGATLYEATLAPRRASGDSLLRIGVAGPSVAQMARVYGVERRSFGPIEAMGAGVAQTSRAISTIGTSLGRIFTGRDAARENLGGPIKVAKTVREEARDGGAPAFWGIVAMLSLTLAIMNILPIPALDGGHLVFLLWEAVTRREPSLKVRIALQNVGMVVLLVFMVFLFVNDALSLV